GPLNELKTRLGTDPRYFEKMIQTHLIDNPHRTIIRFKPDPELGRQLEEQEQTRLQSVRGTMSEDDIRTHVENTKQLKKLQETPDSPEALDTIPTLELDDLEKEVKTIPIEEIQVQDAKVLYHDIFTNGIFYLDLAFDLRA